MNAGMPVWEARISPVFEVAQNLLLISVANGKEVSRFEATLGDTFPPHRVSRLLALDVGVLICGAICRSTTAMVMATGIRLIPFVAGDVEAVLRAQLRGQLPNPRFAMPGCRGGQRRRFCGGRSR